MKVIDIISEAKQAKITKRQNQSSRGISIYGDSERANSDYVAFKLGQAMAGSDGTTPIDIDAKSRIIMLSIYKSGLFAYRKKSIYVSITDYIIYIWKIIINFFTIT
jgi:hypothetical protein